MRRRTRPSPNSWKGGDPPAVGALLFSIQRGQHFHLWDTPVSAPSDTKLKGSFSQKSWNFPGPAAVYEVCLQHCDPRPGLISSIALWIRTAPIPQPRDSSDLRIFPDLFSFPLSHSSSSRFRFLKILVPFRLTVSQVWVRFLVYTGHLGGAVGMSAWYCHSDWTEMEAAALCARARPTCWWRRTDGVWAGLRSGGALTGRLADTDGTAQVHAANAPGPPSCLLNI